MTTSDIAKRFGCTPGQVKRQFARNSAQLAGMARQAKGRKVNGYSASELLAMAATAAGRAK